MYALWYMLSFDQTVCSSKEKQLDCKFRLCFEIAKDLQESSLFNQPQCSQTLWESLADKPFQTVIIQTLPAISVCSTLSFAALCDQKGVSISHFLIDGNQK